MAHRDDDDDVPSDRRGEPPPSPGGDATLERASIEELVARRQIGRYELGPEIGRGACGTIHRAFDTVVGRDVALKLIPADPASQALGGATSRSPEEAFRREITAAGRLEHPNIVRLYDGGRDGDLFFLAMELVNGPTLKEALEARGTLPVDEVVALGATVAQALHFAHELGVVHRDVKPSNLLLPRAGGIKVADFGIASFTQARVVTTEGSFFGTANYASPEQIKGIGVDGRSDLFSLGIVIYEALTGRHPFKGPSIAGTLHAILAADPFPADQLRREVSADLWRVLSKVLSKDPADRYADGESLSRALLDPSSTADRSSARPSRRELLLLMGMVGAAAGSYLVFRASGARTGSPPDPGNRGIERSFAGREDEGHESARPPSSEPITFGVAPYEPVTASSETDWMREALRDSLNTELSQLSAVKVYSKEFVELLMRRKHVSELEAMSELGVKKMMSGSFTVFNDHLRVTTRVVDVKTGVLDISYETDGSPEDFFDLRNRVVLEAIDRLKLPVSEAERQAIVLRQKPSVETLKRFMAAEGSARPASLPTEKPVQEPHSALTDWIARQATLASTAEAAEDAEGAIGALLERYREAIEGRNLDTMSAIYLDYSREQREAQKAYFENVRDLRVGISGIEIVVVDNEAVVSFTRTDDFIDAETGQPMHMVNRLTKTLQQRDGAWRMRAEG